MLVLVAICAGAQSNAPARLALILKDSAVSVAGDLLTAELSKKSTLQLLERSEIDKLYREQAMSATGQDCLKLGRILGADGLLLLESIQDGTNHFLTTQLVAVKPGVLLSGERFPWPSDATQWASGFANYHAPLWPKLSVLAQDAVPISVVNLRSAVQSLEMRETERLLAGLAIERLSHERQLFLLERRNMQLLAAEKELKGLDDSPFWNGSYLLDGTLDPDGYSPAKLTLRARLVPPRNGPPFVIEVSGSRTNFSEIVNRLADKVLDGLKLGRSPAPWSGSDEAQQYFEEANWALKWGIIAQAQTAAESAWALGKQDLDCASIRIRSRLPEIRSGLGNFQHGSIGFGPGTESLKERDKNEIRRIYAAAVFKEKNDKVDWAGLDSPPAPLAVDQAVRALELYQDLCRLAASPQPLNASQNTGANGGRISDWYRLGLDDLLAGSQVLHQFSLMPAAQKPLAEQLAALRAQARSVAEILAAPRYVQESYFVGERLATHDELANTIGESWTIFRCKLDWGCFWQETPEDALALYRHLMSSPVFCYLHTGFWNRDTERPRLVAWDEATRQRLPRVWSGFIEELNRSTNLLCRMEAKALLRADAPDKASAAARLAELLDLIRSNRAELVGHNVELFYQAWGLGEFPELSAMDREYWDKTIPARRTLVLFEKQKDYLANFTPYEQGTFMQVFAVRNYTRSQAATLKPLLEAYRSNLLASPGTTQDKFKARASAQWVQALVEKRVDELLNPSPPPPAQAPVLTMAPASPPAVRGTATNRPAPVLELTAEPLLVTRFLPIPRHELPATNLTVIKVFEHCLRGDKLLLDLRYEDSWQERYPTATQYRLEYHHAVALRRLDRWEIILAPSMGEMESSLFHSAPSSPVSPLHHLEWHDNVLYLSDPDAVRRYDFSTRQWQQLPLAGQSRFQLFAVNGRLYAASSESICEIQNGGENTSILASTRRRPVASLLDSNENLGQPVLLAGPQAGLRVALAGSVFGWNGRDWASLFSITNGHSPELFGDLGLFRAPSTRHWVEFWRLRQDDTNAQLCRREEERATSGIILGSEPAALNQPPAPLWKTPRGLSLALAPAALDGPNLYFYVDRSEFNRASQTNAAVLARRGRHADLVCLTPDSPEPFVVPIRFDPASGPAPSQKRHDNPWQSSIWMECSSKEIFIGQSELPGVWVVPASDFRSALTRQAQQRSTAAAEVTKALFTKYDRNGNGRIDPEEKAMAIADPLFLEAELEKIDTNGNGQLDAEEIRYFDANTNGLLEANEEAAIGVAQKVLAAQLAREFDEDEDGKLSRAELMAAFRNAPDMTALSTFLRANQDPDSTLNPERLDGFLRQRTERSLFVASHPGSPMAGAMFLNPARPDKLKESVEAYWRGSTRNLRGRPSGPPSSGRPGFTVNGTNSPAGPAQAPAAVPANPKRQ